VAESEDFEYLENEWKKQYLKNYYLRCSAQRRFLGLLRGSIQGLMEPEFAKIKALDFLQGMPVLVALREVISDVVQSELPALQAQALGVGKELVAESKSSYEEILFTPFISRACVGSLKFSYIRNRIGQDISYRISRLIQNIRPKISNIWRMNGRNNTLKITIFIVQLNADFWAC